MKRLISSFVLALLFVGVMGQGTSSGQKIFERKCTRCHGKNGNKGFLGAKDLTKSTVEFNSLKTVIQNGRGLMPAWKDELTTEEIDYVAAYILTLRQRKR